MRGGGKGEGLRPRAAALCGSVSIFLYPVQKDFNQMFALPH
jgi:hypothetical protein